jgi:threonine dehydratase
LIREGDDHVHAVADPRQALGQITFPIIQRLADDMVTTTDEQLVQALRFFAERMKIVVEPTGALAFAGAEHGSVDVRGARVGLLISGGNVDMTRYSRFLAD